MQMSLIKMRRYYNIPLFAAMCIVIPTTILFKSSTIVVADSEEIHQNESSEQQFSMSSGDIVVGDNDSQTDDSEPEPLFLTPFNTEDYDCWSKTDPINWESFRREFYDTIKDDPPPKWKFSDEFFSNWSKVLMHFPDSVTECPIGAITSSILAASYESLKFDAPQDSLKFPTYFLKTPAEQIITRDLQQLSQNFEWRILVGTEWPVWRILCEMKFEHPNERNARCNELFVSGYPGEFVLKTIQKSVRLAENKGLQAAMFLKELDPMIYGMMKDPREFASVFIPNCPSGAMSIAVVSCVLALMAQPMLFEKFGSIAKWILTDQVDALVSKESTDWKLFCLLHALGTFRLRHFDLQFKMDELYLPQLRAIGQGNNNHDIVGLHVDGKREVEDSRSIRRSDSSDQDQQLLNSDHYHASKSSDDEKTMELKTTYKNRKYLTKTAEQFDAEKFDSPNVLRALERGCTEINPELSKWLLDELFPLYGVFRRGAAKSSASTFNGRKKPVVYLSAVGGKMMANYIDGFAKRFFELQLQGLIIACLDQVAYDKCLVAFKKISQISSKSAKFLCLNSQQGHVIYNKHRWIPILLSAHIDVLWLDFDIYLLKDPVEHIRAIRQIPTREISPVDPGNFTLRTMLTVPNNYHDHQYDHNHDHDHDHINNSHSSHVQNRTIAATDTVQQLELEPEEQHPVDLFVTEHYDALCLNSGVFYAVANSKTLNFFLEFLRWQYLNIFADNQNGFDAFLQHSCVDSYIPSKTELLNIKYGLLDVESKFTCGEGWSGPNMEDPILLHFWTSDFDHKNKRKDGSPINMRKDDYFQLCFPPEELSDHGESDHINEDIKSGSIVGEENTFKNKNRNDTEIYSLMEDLRYPRIPWYELERCAVITTGINELIEAKNPGADTTGMKPDHKGFELERRRIVAEMERQKKDQNSAAADNDVTPILTEGESHTSTRLRQHESCEQYCQRTSTSSSSNGSCSKNARITLREQLSDPWIKVIREIQNHDFFGEGYMKKFDNDNNLKNCSLNNLNVGGQVKELIMNVLQSSDRELHEEVRYRLET